MIKEKIISKLNETEINYDVKIPFAIESGSRSWGFASPDSDYDCRFIYVHKKDWYLSIFEKKDIIEYETDGVFDINGWDLKKVLQHMVKSNVTMLEWLSSNDVYKCDEYFRSRLQALGNNFFNPISAGYHYLNIAKNKFAEVTGREEAKLKSYFYMLRPVVNLNFIYQYKKMPYMEYGRTLSETNPKIYNEIMKLKSEKMAHDETYLVKPQKIILDYIQNEIDVFETRLKNMAFTKNRDYKQADEVFKEIIEKVWANG